jgi:hypothetical protein
MGIIEEPRTFLYYQNEYHDREPLILFGGCSYQNVDEPAKMIIKDLRKLFASLLDSIEQAYLIHFNLKEVIRGMSGELSVSIYNLRNQELLEHAQDYHSHYGKNRFIRLKMMNQLYNMQKTNAVWFGAHRLPPFQLFFIHWLESTPNEFFITDLLNAIAINVLNRLGLSAKAHAILNQLATEISIIIRDIRIRYTI